MPTFSRCPSPPPGIPSGFLQRRHEFDVNAIAASSVQVAILNTDHPKNGRPDMTMLRRLHLAHPEVAKILLLGSYDRDLVANAFRSGAKRAVRFFRVSFPPALQVHTK